MRLAESINLLLHVSCVSKHSISISLSHLRTSHIYLRPIGCVSWWGCRLRQLLVQSPLVQSDICPETYRAKAMTSSFAASS